MKGSLFLLLFMIFLSSNTNSETNNTILPEEEEIQPNSIKLAEGIYSIGKKSGIFISH